MKYFFLVIMIAFSLYALSQDDGDLDLTFNSTGIATFGPSTSHDVIQDVALQPDQKIVGCGVVMGSTGFYNFDAAVIRLNADGTVDTDFGTDGYFTHDFNGESDFFYAVKVLDNGKILACGAASITVVDTDILLVRLNNDGTPDESFGGGDGFVIEQVGEGEDYAHSMVVLADGSIIVCGFTGVAGFSYYRGLLMKFSADGILDTDFGDNGKVEVNFNGESDKFYSIALTDDGDIIVSGETYQGFNLLAWVAKFDADGNPVLSFATDGNFTGPAYYMTAFDVITDGPRIVVCGSFNYSADLYVFALDEDGALDATFSGDGLLQVDLANTDVVLDIVQQPDGKYVAAGSSGDDSFTRDFLVARINADGTLDQTFGNAGTVAQSIGASFDEVNAITMQADGKIVAAGFRSGDNNDFAFMRLENEIEVGVNEIVAAGQLAIFPNPANEFITFYMEGISNREKMDVMVRDLSGRICLTQSCAMGQMISLKNLAPGQYIMNATSANGGSNLGKLVVE